METVMIYMGHFSFQSRDVVPQASGAWHGYFTCTAEAESVEKALDKFQVLLRRLARTSTLFSEVAEVYLDSCIEIKSIRKDGFLAYYKEMRGECKEAISTSLVGIGTNKAVIAYQFTGEQCEDDVDASATQPFLVFR
jgi:hypothetical protein